MARLPYYDEFVAVLCDPSTHGSGWARGSISTRPVYSTGQVRGAYRQWSAAGANHKVACGSECVQRWQSVVTNAVIPYDEYGRRLRAGSGISVFGGCDLAGTVLAGAGAN